MLNRSNINAKILMLLQLHEIENKDRLIMLMAQALRIYPPRMRNIINNFSIMKGGGENGIDIVVRGGGLASPLTMLKKPYHCEGNG